MSYFYEYKEEEEEEDPGENSTAEVTISIGEDTVMITCYEGNQSANVILPLGEARKLGALLQNFGKDAK